MLGALVWICCLTVVAAQRGGGGFLPSQVLAGGGGGALQTTTPIPILKDSRRIDLQTGAFVYEYIGGDGSSKFEFRYPNGTVVGNFSFVNEQGELETRVYNHGAEVDETTDPNYIDLGNYELYRHLERPYVHREGAEEGLQPHPLQFSPQAPRSQAPLRRRQRQRRPRPQPPPIQIQPQFQPVPQPPPQPRPQPQFKPQPRPQPQPQFRPQPQAQPQPQFQPQPQPQFRPQPQVQRQPQFQPQQQPQFRPQPQVQAQPQFRPQPQAQARPTIPQISPPRSSPAARPSLIDAPTFQIPAPRQQHRLDLSQQNNANNPDAFLDSVIARFN